jgi:anti-sigma B factor antagonist
MNQFFCSREGNQTVIFLPRQFNGPNAAILSTLCKNHLTNGVIRFVVDASNLQFIDTEGIGVLLRNALRLQEFGGEISIRNLEGWVLQLFRKVGLEDIFKITNEAHTT